MSLLRSGRFQIQRPVGRSTPGAGGLFLSAWEYCSWPFVQLQLVFLLGWCVMSDSFFFLRDGYFNRISVDVIALVALNDLIGRVFACLVQEVADVGQFMQDVAQVALCCPGMAARGLGAFSVMGNQAGFDFGDRASDLLSGFFVGCEAVVLVLGSAFVFCHFRSPFWIVIMNIAYIIKNGTGQYQNFGKTHNPFIFRSDEELPPDGALYAR